MFERLRLAAIIGGFIAGSVVAATTAAASPLTPTQDPPSTESATYALPTPVAPPDGASGAIKVEKMTLVVDPGIVINPLQLKRQVEGGAVMGVSIALKEELRFDESGVNTNDWQSYPILTFSEAPKVEIELIDRPTAPPLGAGEAACTPVAAALANAIHDASGVRLRTVPFTPERLKAARNQQST